MLPDWHMFHSLHTAAEYHASTRAISGGRQVINPSPSSSIKISMLN